MKKIAILILIFALGFVPVVFAQFQEKGFVAAEEDEEEAVIKVTTVNIGLPVTVLDDKGRFVRNLKRDNFRVYEDNRPQQIIEFHAQSGLPLNVGVVMDTSTSVRNRLEFEKAAVKQFLGSVVQTNLDRIAFSTFDENVTVREEFTNDIPKVMRAVDEVKVVGGQTSLYDAVFKMARDMTRAPARRRVIVVLSDGADTSSKHTLAETIALAQRNEISVYGISTKGGAVFRVEGSPYLNADDRDLRKLCRETGGDIFFPSNVEELTRAFRLVTEYLRNQYLIVYEPTSNNDGRFHKIDVQVVGQKGLSTLSRQGYIAK